MWFPGRNKILTSFDLVKILNLLVIKHSQPYHLNIINNSVTYVVEYQFKTKFIVIRIFKDEVVCNIVHTLGCLSYIVVEITIYEIYVKCK